MDEKELLEKIKSSYYYALKNNELDQFLAGVNEYKILMKDGVDPCRTSSDITLKGINYVCKRNRKNQKRIGNAINQMLEKNNIDYTFAVTSILRDYLYLQKRNNLNFQLNIQELILKLNFWLMQQKQEMLEYKEGAFSVNEKGMWGVVEFIVNDIDDSFGYKIFSCY